MSPTDPRSPAALDLRAEVQRGRALDRELARDLGRPEPATAAAAGDYVAALERRPVLPAATERELVVRAQAGDGEARARLVEAFTPLVASVARTYRSGQVQRLELLQEGVVGLLRALEGFDPDRAGRRSGPTPRGGCARRRSSSWPS